MKFNFEEWKDKKVVMHCSTREEAKNFCKVMHEAGKRWRFGNYYSSTTYWEKYEKETCYDFNEDLFSDLSYFKAKNYIILEWSDYMKKTFTKSKLKNGDVIVRRDGSVEIVCVETGTLITQTGGYNVLSYIENDLTCPNHPEFDIIDVYRSQHPSQCQFGAVHLAGKHIFHREDLPIEITIDEVAKLKGVSVDRIKIVK